MAADRLEERPFDSFVDERRLLPELVLLVEFFAFPDRPIGTEEALEEPARDPAERFDVDALFDLFAGGFFFDVIGGGSSFLR